MNLENPKYWRLLINQSFLRFFLLKSLSQRPLHGYALIEALVVASNGICKPSQGTIYPALSELEKDGYLKGRWEKIKGRKRKIYSLTPKGRNALASASSMFQKALAAFSSEEKNLTKLPLETDSTKNAKLPL